MTLLFYYILVGLIFLFLLQFLTKKFKYHFDEKQLKIMFSLKANIIIVFLWPIFIFSIIYFIVMKLL